MAWSLAEATAKKAVRPLSRQGNVFRSSTPKFEVSRKARATPWGGVALLTTFLQKIGFAGAVNDVLGFFKIQQPYSESDHVINIALNTFAGGQTLDDINLRRQDPAFLEAVQAGTIPAPTTSGDFCRRFAGNDLTNLMEAVNRTRVGMWQEQGAEFLKIARVDADGVFVETGAECAEGIDYSYKKMWGYHPLVISLANTGEPLFVVNRKGSAQSHEGAAEWFDRSIPHLQAAGFEIIRFRGDTDFSQTKYLDGWNAKGIEFVFGFDSKPELVARVESRSDLEWRLLLRDLRMVDEEDERAHQPRIKEQLVREKGFKNLVLEEEHYAEIDYSPVACDETYRLVVLRKTIRVEKGHELLFPEVRYLFYITNIRNCDAREIIREANNRCNQENLHAQLKSLRALRAPLKDLVSNWAYMVMTSLAWSFKAWLALAYPVLPRSEDADRAMKRRLITMEYRTFFHALVGLPCQIVKTARQTIVRLLATSTPWLPVFKRLAKACSS